MLSSQSLFDVVLDTSLQNGIINSEGVYSHID